MCASPTTSAQQGAKIALIHTTWYADIITGLVQSATQVLQAAGQNIYTHTVAGSYELPLAAKQQLLRSDVLGVVALGCLIQGETKHFEFISHACAQGLMQVSLELLKPIGFGIITADDHAQAQRRSQQNAKNKGYEAAHAVLQQLSIRGING